MRKKNRIRILALLLALVLCACSGPAVDPTSQPTSNPQDTVLPEQTTVPVPAATPTPVPTQTPMPESLETGLLHPVKEFTASTYSDLLPEDACLDAVKTAYSYGVLRDRDGSFDPQEPLDIKDLMSLAARLHMGYTTGNINFEEEDGERWDKCYREYCQKKGVWRSPPAWTKLNIVWNMFVSVLANSLPKEAFTSINEIPESAIPGVEENDDYHDAVYLLYRAGILPCSPEDSTFYPNREITRAEAVEVAARMVDPSRRVSVSIESTPIVSFLLEDGSLYEEQKLNKGEVATEPEAPTRDRYAFIGWFTDPEAGDPYDFTTPVMGDQTLYAHWEESGKYPEGYSIEKMAWDPEQHIMTVWYYAAEQKHMQIKLYSSDRTAELSRIGGNVPATEPEQTEPSQATFTISGEIPEHFFATAQLYSSITPLCDPFLFLDETEEYQTFLTKTVADYEAEGAEVLNLDDQQSTNFLVLSDDVTLLPQDDSLLLTSYDTDAGTYVFEGDIASLEQYQRGDCLVYADGTASYAIAVEEIHREGNSMVVQAMGEASMGDFFSAVKIDTVGNGTVGGGTVPLGSVPDIDKEYDGEKSFTKTFTNAEEGKDKTLVYNVTINGGAKFHFLMYYDLKLFGADYLKVETLVTLDAGFNSVLDLNAGSSSGEYKLKYLHLTDLNFPIPMTWNILDINASLDFAYRWKVDGHADFNFTFHKELGFNYQQVGSETSFQTINTQTTKRDMHANAHFNVEVGLNGLFSLNVLGDLLQLKIPAYVGVELDAIAQGTVLDAANGIQHDEDKYHACALCLDGDLYLNTDATFEATYNILNNWKGTIGETKNLLKGHRHLTDLYLSILNDKDSIHGGSIAFGLGNCPNYIYKVTVKARNAEKDEVSVDFTIGKTRNVLGGILGTSGGSDTDGEVVLMGTTPYTGYLYPTSFSTGPHKDDFMNGYVAFAVIDGQESSSTFVVSDHSASVLLVAGQKPVETLSPEETDTPNVSENPDDTPDNPPDVPWVVPTDQPSILDPNSPENPVNMDIPEVPKGTRAKYSGMCGDNASWTFFENGVLVIAGKGSIHRAGWARFYIVKDVKRLVILHGITEIEEGTFYGDVFQGDGAGSELVLPDSITIIGKDAFRSTHITGVVIPDSVKEIGSRAFYDCTYLGGELVIGDGVLEIGEFAFCQCAGLTSIHFGNSIETIGNFAFNCCTGLTGDLILPDSLLEVGAHAFGECTGLDGQLYLSSNLEQVGEYAFGSYRNKDPMHFTGNLIIPDSVISIGDHAFWNWTTDGFLQIGDGVREIGAYAFHRDNFTGLRLGTGIVNIGEHAFDGLAGVKDSLTIGDSVKHIGAGAFLGCGFTGTLWIGNGVETIGMCAFSDCEGIERAVFGSNVSTLGDDVFNNCTNLKEVYFYGDAPTCNLSRFNRSVHIYYLEGTDGWTNPWHECETSPFSP